MKKLFSASDSFGYHNNHICADITVTFRDGSIWGLSLPGISVCCTANDADPRDCIYVCLVPDLREYQYCFCMEMENMK